VTVALIPVVDALPVGFDALRAEACAEGHRNIDRLAIDWASGEARFDACGEALLAALVAGELAGIGGITIDPNDCVALRMRRFYVRTVHRRTGVGRRLAGALMAGAGHSRCLVVNAGTEQAARFWEALAFTPDDRDGHTHILRRGPG
jgi:GNAT superfamily N-acetyltransferase